MALDFPIANQLLMSLLRRLRNPDVRNLALYGLVTALAAVITLIVTRVLWRSLSPADFGAWALIDPMLVPGASLVLLGIDHAIVKQLRIDRLPLASITGILLTSTVPATTICLIVIGLAAGFVFHLSWTPALLLTMTGEALILMMQTAFRATGAVHGFAGLTLSRNLLYLVVLVVISARFIQGDLSIGIVFLTRGACVIFVSVLAVVALRPVMRPDRPRYLDAVRYGFPLLLTTFIFALTDMADRWFLVNFDGLIEAGVYALHLKIAAILSQAIVIPFGLWFPPERFRRLDQPDGGRSFFIRTALVLSLICGYLAGAVWLARDTVLPLITPGLVASPLVLGCCLGAVICLALSQALNVGLLLPGHTSKNAICSIYSVIAIVMSCSLLVPVFGANGAAVSRLVGGLVLVGATAAWSNLVFPIAFPFATMILYFAAAAAVAFGIDYVVAGRGMLFALLGWTAATSFCALVGWRLLRIDWLAAHKRVARRP